jgi:hypothetical protein
MERRHLLELRTLCEKHMRERGLAIESVQGETALYISNAIAEWRLSEVSLVRHSVRIQQHQQALAAARGLCEQQQQAITAAQHLQQQAVAAAQHLRKGRCSDSGAAAPAAQPKAASGQAVADIADACGAAAPAAQPVVQAVAAATGAATPAAPSISRGGIRRQPNLEEPPRAEQMGT